MTIVRCMINCSEHDYFAVWNGKSCACSNDNTRVNRERFWSFMNLQRDSLSDSYSIGTVRNNFYFGSGCDQTPCDGYVSGAHGGQWQKEEDRTCGGEVDGLGEPTMVFRFADADPSWDNGWWINVLMMFCVCACCFSPCWAGPLLFFVSLTSCS